ncbi:MAG TPA: succinylglutamate desuccinylase/aspartoacylase family protein [Candidatus Acidoferrum sp.]|nr:succinylglutamate desuccinylase/aspartoacylase family protein [Candidatus Acidoferrum sp.]
MTKTIDRIPLLPYGLDAARQLTVHRYGTPGARPKAYLHASLHADEVPAMLVLHHLVRLLDEADRAGAIKGEIVVVPMANPIGMSQVVNARHVGRYELAGGGNFNRNWPDLFIGLADRVRDRLTDDAARNVTTVRAAMVADLAARTPGSEFASLRLALARLAVDADIVLDCHCDSESLLHLFLVPAHWPSAADLSAEIGSRATLVSEDSGGHAFDETFSTPWTRLARAIPDKPVPAACLSATVEYRGQAEVGDEWAEPDGRALFRFLQRRGLVAGDPGPLPQRQCEATRLDACDVVRTPAAGIVAYKQPLGATVTAGTVIAEIVDPTAADPRAARTPVRTVADGLLLSRRIDKLVRPGDSLAKVVGTKPLPSRTGDLLED